MSIGNLVQATLTTAITAAATVITLDAAVPPYSLPPVGGGTLILADSLSRPTKYEIIKYGARSGQNLTGVTRGQEGSTAQAWPVGGLIYQSLTAGMFTPSFTPVQSATDLYVDLFMGGDSGVTGRFNLLAATPTVGGVMSAADKTKLNGITAGAQPNVGTDLSASATPGSVTIASSTGASTNLPFASFSVAGILLPASYTKLSNVHQKVSAVQTANFTALVKADYVLGSDITVTLPLLSTISHGDQIRFNKFLDAAPTIQASGSDTIKTKSGTDTSVKFNINATLVVTANKTAGVWEI